MNRLILIGFATAWTGKRNRMEGLRNSGMPTLRSNPTATKNRGKPEKQLKQTHPKTIAKAKQAHKTGSYIKY